MGRRNNRSLKITEHHIIPKSRHGVKEPGNVLNLERSKHDAWHILFDNKTLDEIIHYLRRLQNEQEEKILDNRYSLRQRGGVFVLPEPKVGSFDPQGVLDFPAKKHFAWYSLFGNRNIEEAISCLELVRGLQKQSVKEKRRDGISIAAFA